MKAESHASRGPGRSGGAGTLRIFIVEDHPVFSEGLAQLLSHEKDLTVCGKSTNGSDALKAFVAAKPDLILIDISLPGKSGLELIKDIRAMDSKIAILVISMHEETLYAERVLRAGARGYVMKHETPEVLLRAIRQVLGGQMYFSATISSQILATLSSRKPKSAVSTIGQLSDREFEVLNMLGQGKDSHAIARQLHLSFKTVDAHRARIKKKLNLRSATELICYAARWVEARQPAQGAV